MLKHRINTIFSFTVFVVLGALAFFNLISWWWLLAPLLLWFTITGFGSGFVSSNYHVKAYCGNPSVKGSVVSITFDDGPTPETPKVLELLKKHNAKATFFCIGRQVEQYPEIIKQVISEGHTVGNHTYSHSPNIGFFSTAKLIDELEQTNRLIKETAGKKAKLFRPPYGVTTPKLARALKATGHTVIGWNNRSLDGILKDEDMIYKRIEHRLAPGCIILMHDTSQKSVNVLERLLVLLQQYKYKSVTVDQLLNISPYEEE